MSSPLFASYLPAGSSCAVPCATPAPCAPACPVNPCAPKCGSGSGYYVGGGILVFLVIWLTMWMIFVSLNPWFIRRVERGEKEACENAQPCLTRAFVASLVAALIVSALIWLVCACS